MTNPNQTKTAAILAGIMAATGTAGLATAKAKKKTDKVFFSPDELAQLAKLGPKAKKPLVRLLKQKYFAERRGKA
jgi:hypothetical protein